MKITFSVNLTEKDLYGFLLNNTYRRFTGAAWLIFSVIAAGAAVYTWGSVPLTNTLLLLALASLYTILNPIMLYAKARKQIRKNKDLENLEYTFTEKGVLIRQGDAEAENEWDTLWKAVNYGPLVVIYVTTVRAFILPVSAMEGQYENLSSLAKSRMGMRCHLKQVKKND